MPLVDAAVVVAAASSVFAAAVGGWSGIGSPELLGLHPVHPNFKQLICEHCAVAVATGVAVAVMFFA